VRSQDRFAQATIAAISGLVPTMFMTRVSNTGPWTRTLHALPRLSGSSRLSLQTQPSGHTAAEQNYGRRSAIDVVAGGR